VQDPVIFGGYTAGAWITIDQLVTVAGNATNGFTKMYPNTTASGSPRNNAVAYQTLFNSINDNLATVTPPTSGAARLRSSRSQSGGSNEQCWRGPGDGAPPFPTV
jgi:hypothetical protein